MSTDPRRSYREPRSRRARWTIFLLLVILPLTAICVCCGIYQGLNVDVFQP
ncbi:hypothetical protein AB0M47_11735 [Hamadaea sp. NPDC051192]|uniref:hypothetical protein n=1 Tax=Hamadaea sp. NPDC051192 TaxID=3154940 RepID=UPI003440B56D